MFICDIFSIIIMINIKDKYKEIYIDIYYNNRTD
jgi:hypothetical protein